MNACESEFATCVFCDGGAWVRVSTAEGSIELVAHLDEAQLAGTLRVPHGWWKPETSQRLENGLSGAQLHNDGVFFPGAA